MSRRLAVLSTAVLLVMACSESPSAPPVRADEHLPETADLGTVESYAPVLRRRCKTLTYWDGCPRCVDRNTDAELFFECNGKPHVEYLQIKNFAHRDAPLREGIVLAADYLEPLMTEPRMSKLLDMAAHATIDIVPPLSLSNIGLYGYSVDGLAVFIDDWIGSNVPTLRVEPLTKKSVRRVEGEWTLGKVPKREWRR